MCHVYKHGFLSEGGGHHRLAERPDRQGTSQPGSNLERTSFEQGSGESEGWSRPTSGEDFAHHGLLALDHAVLRHGHVRVLQEGGVDRNRVTSFSFRTLVSSSGPSNNAGETPRLPHIAGSDGQVGVNSRRLTCRTAWHGCPKPQHVLHMLMAVQALSTCPSHPRRQVQLSFARHDLNRSAACRRSPGHIGGTS